MAQSRVVIAELREEDLPFLLELWRVPEVMRYADELPRLRGWSKSTEPEAAWREYQRRRAELGPAYTQMILQLNDGTRIGESFFAPLEGVHFWPLAEARERHERDGRHQAAAPRSVCGFFPVGALGNWSPAVSTVERSICGSRIPTIARSGGVTPARTAESSRDTK